MQPVCCLGACPTFCLSAYDKELKQGRGEEARACWNASKSNYLWLCVLDDDHSLQLDDTHPEQA
jgi:hypothetical protein